MLKPMQLPKEYLITYEVMEKDSIRTITNGRDKDDRIYFHDGDRKVLYVPENGRYDLYEPGGDGTFVRSGSAQYTMEHIDSNTYGFSKYAEQSPMQYNGAATMAET